MNAWKEWVGVEVAVEFDLPGHQWPISGSPAWVVIGKVDMPLILMGSIHTQENIWVNAKLIKTIHKSG